jgi:hypothetical protein
MNLLEKHIEQTIREFLEWDDWRVFHFEQNFSERKRKTVGEGGMPDLLCIRYGRGTLGVPTDGSSDVVMWLGDVVMWLELKAPKGRVAARQKLWHEAERKRGALTLIAGEDFPATIEGFEQWYRLSGLMRRKM